MIQFFSIYLSTSNNTSRLHQHQHTNKYLSVQGHIEQYRAINKLDRLTYVSSTVYVTEIKMFWNCCLLFDAFELL